MIHDLHCCSFGREDHCELASATLLHFWHDLSSFCHQCCVQLPVVTLLVTDRTISLVPRYLVVFHNNSIGCPFLINDNYIVLRSGLSIIYEL